MLGYYVYLAESALPRMPTFVYFMSDNFLERHALIPLTHARKVVCVASHHADLYRIVGEIKSS